jgi:hypothetical protein
MEDFQLQVRTDTVVKEDGQELSRQYFRVVLAPGDDVSGYPKIVQDVANLLWTPEVIAERQAKMALLKAEAESRVSPPAPAN